LFGRKNISKLKEGWKTLRLNNANQEREKNTERYCKKEKTGVHLITQK
jgi:hypothetical protein